MAFVPPKDRVLEKSTTAGTGPYTVTGAIDTSYNAFSASMAVGDTTIGSIVEPGVAFWTGILTYSATNQITATTVAESKGTFGSGTKEIFMGLPASRSLSFDGAQSLTTTQQAQARSNILATGNLVAVTVYTSSATWTRAANTKSVFVEVKGGGGGGGGVGGAAGQISGGGGGEGGKSRKRIAAPGATETVTVGAGGAGGANTGGNGATGGTSSFGSWCSATGGLGGLGNTTVGRSSGNEGGLGVSGDLNEKGANGFVGVSDNLYPQTPGSGGGGGGGLGYVLQVGVGNVGTLGGGGGGAGSGGSAAAVGGAGGGGYVIVWEYA